MIMDRFDFSGLTLDEKALLAHEIWHSLQEEIDSMRLDEDIKKELLLRYEAEKSGEIRHMSWEEVKSRLASGGAY